MGIIRVSSKYKVRLCQWRSQNFVGRKIDANKGRAKGICRNDVRPFLGKIVDENQKEKLFPEKLST